MRIVMLCEFFNEKLEFQENLLAKYYVKHGHAVTIITSTFESVFDYYTDQHDSSLPARTYIHEGAKIIKLRYRFNIVNRLRAYTPISSILNQEKPDLIYVHDIMLNLPEAIRYKKRHANCRLILDYHADYSNSGKNWLSRFVLHGVFRKWYLDRARPHLSRIFPVVPASATFLHEIYGVPYEEMELLPLGADTDLGAKTRELAEGEKLRRQMGISPRSLVIFTGGKLTPNRRTELLIEAVRSLERSDVHLVIVGDAGKGSGEYPGMLRQLSGSMSNVHFTGWLDKQQIYAHLDMADLAVFPASQSIMWQQAISMGLPLVVGDVGSQDISYLNLRDNIVILRGSEITVSNLAITISGIIDNRQRMKVMGDGARAVAEQWLNWDQLILKTLRYNSPNGEMGGEA